MYPTIPPKLGLLRLRVPYMHQEGRKKFTTHIMRLLGKNKTSSQAGPRLAFKKGKRNLLDFVIVKG